MSVLVRKIDLGRWREKEFYDRDEIAGDAITRCLTTSNNTLSVWKSEPEEEEINKAVLAFASKCSKLETLNFVLLNEKYLQDNSVDLEHQDVSIPYREQILNHMILCRITYDKLGTVARFILNEVKANREIRYVKGRLKKMLNDAISDGKLRLEDLDSRLQEKLK